MSQANGKRDELVEDGRLKLQAEEFRIVREESRIQISFDGGKIKSVILEPRVVAHHKKCDRGESEEQRQIRGGRITSAEFGAGRIGGLRHLRVWHSRRPSRLQPALSEVDGAVRGRVHSAGCCTDIRRSRGQMRWRALLA